MPKTSLYNKVTSPEEVYKAIYALESYIFEKHLLDEDDYNTYIQLQDKYNESFINFFTEECIARIKEVLDTDAFFDCKVFFRPKKYDKDSGEVDFRPLHTASLKDQVCMVVLLSALMFDDSKGKRKLSAISRLLPANFYGNIPSTNLCEIFKPWYKQYKNYSDNIIEANKRFVDTKKYKYEVTLDLEKFFPSINPAFIHSYITSKWNVNATEEDKAYLAKILVKLLYFNTSIPDELTEHYYPDSIPKSKCRFNIGIAQGLPQAYFFGNICMSIISTFENNLLDGESFYYVDDSVAFSNENIGQDELDKLVEDINAKINDITLTPQTNNVPLDSYIESVSNKYKILIHPIKEENKGKSYVEKISPINSLALLAAPASTLSNEIRTAQDEFEDISLLNKTKALLEAVILLISEPHNETDLKRLHRFKKHYQNKVNLLERTQSVTDIVSKKDMTQFIKRNGLNLKAPNEKFFDELDNGVFLFEVQTIAEQISTNDELFNVLLESISNLEYSCLNTKETSALNESLYFSKVLRSINSHPVSNNKRYNTLNASKELRAVEQRNRLSNEIKINCISDIVKQHM